MAQVAAVAQIWSLAQEPPHAMGGAKGKKKMEVACISCIIWDLLTGYLSSVSFSKAKSKEMFTHGK